MSWRITLLGKAEVTREGKTISRFESSRTIALLARLALFGRQTHPREELIELLWPEVEATVARGRLRRALFILRQQLESGLPVGSVLVADRLTVHLNPEAFTTDAALFEQAVARKDFARARRLYGGALLPGLWDDWIVEERHRLEALADDLPLAPAERETAPAPKPVSPRRLLPSYLTAFFGREREQEEIRILLQNHRLVTLTGLGGTGKTRLAAEVAQRLPAAFEPVCFVALADCVDASQMHGRISAALGLPTGAADPLEQAALHLEDKPALLVLDNLEQLAESGAAERIEALLARLPLLTCLVTTRRALSIPGERLYPLETLPPETSVTLFLDRAQAVRPGFHATGYNRSDIEAVCRGLEGIPLALELAASRLRAFSVGEMRQELQNRFEWLARAGRQSGGDKGDRHRSLQAALEWSWRLLSPSQQQNLAALSLLPAPWGLAHGRAVCDAADTRECWECVESLVMDSLLASEAAESGETRFTMRETVREFVRPRLENVPAARRRLREGFLRVPAHDENMIAAWEYAIQDGDSEHAYALAETHYSEWGAIAGLGRARTLLERTLALPAPGLRPRLRAWHQVALLLQRTNERAAALSLMDAAVAETGTAEADVRAEGLVLRAHTGMFDEPAHETLFRLDQALVLASAPLVRAEALRIKGAKLLWTTDYASAGPLFDAAEPLYPADHRGLRALLLNRAQLAEREEDLAPALALYEACADQAGAFGDTLMGNLCHANIAQILARQEDWQAAARAGRGCLRAAHRLGDRYSIGAIVWNLAGSLLEVGEAALAVRLFRFAADFWEREVRPLTSDEHDELGAFRAKAVTLLGEAAWEPLWEEGKRLTLGEAVASALGNEVQE